MLISECFWVMMRRSRPQQLREQLLLAIDEQNNIHNMGLVLDVIYRLEKCPMTEEALMETRLGKLINDVRKKSTDEGLVKRLKRLVRGWQRLIGEDENELPCSADTSRSNQSEFISRSTQTVGTFVDSNVSQVDERSVPDKSTNHQANVRRSKIPIRANKPYSSSPMSTKQGVKEQSVRTFENKAKTQQASFPIRHNECHPEVNIKPAQLNRSSLTYDHQKFIQECKTFNPGEDCQRILKSASRDSEGQKTCFEFVQETNSSETTQRNIIKADMNFLNRLTMPDNPSSRMSFHFAKNSRQGDDAKECMKTNVFIQDFCMTELPGISRELTENDIYRLHHDRWHGVNGCYDSRNNWCDWTQSVILDSYGSPLKISPYVCIDQRL